MARSPAGMGVTAQPAARRNARVKARGKVGAIVIGASYRALGIVRSLGRHEIPVWVLREEGPVGTIGSALAVRSRYASRVLPWPAASAEQRVDLLLELATRHGLHDWVVFPSGDAEAALIARRWVELADCLRLTTPAWEVFRWAHDKRMTYQLAADVGVDVPWTAYPRSEAEVAALECAFPVILKPAVKEEANALTDAKAWRVDDRASLRERYRMACTLVSPDTLMVQELIHGGGESQYSFAALCDGGRPLAWLTARRLRQYPMDFGRASTYVETVDEPAVEEPARALLEAIGFTGLVEVEFKRDPDNGSFKLLDVNGRVWGWHTIGLRAGVDFPMLTWQFFLGQTIRKTSGRAGVRWVWALPDAVVAAREVMAGRLSVATYLASFCAPVTVESFAGDDLLPGLVELPLLSLLAVRRRRRSRELCPAV